MVDSPVHLFFVDESGTPPGPGKGRDTYFVIAGVSVPEKSWPGLRDAFDGMKIRRGLRGELKWRYFSPSNQEPKNPLRDLSQELKDEIRTELYGMLSADHAIRSIACVTDIMAAYNLPYITNRDELYEFTYKPLSERFQYHLQGLDNGPSDMAYGIVICDHRGAADDKRLKAHHQKLIYSKARNVSVYKNFVESLFLQSSNLSIGIQFADLVAGAVWRSFERGDDRWLSLVRASLRTGKAGRIDGFGLIKHPKSTFQQKVHREKDAG